MKGTFNDGTTESWVTEGTNLMVNENNALKITYVDDVNGAKVYLNSADDLNTDLIIGDTYKVVFRIKVNGSLNIRIYNGTVYTTIPLTALSEYEYHEGEIVPTSTTGCFIMFSSVSVGEIIYLDNYEIFHKTTQTGNNLIDNGGARNAIGALTTTDWDDGNSDGLADGFTTTAGNTPTIVTGNGFSGNAQRVVNDGSSAVRLDTPSFYGISGEIVYVRMKYRTNRSDVRWGFGLGGSALAVNTGDAIEYEELITFTSTGTLARRLDSDAVASASDYIEIDELEFRHVIDGEFYEPEALGADPVIIQTDYFAENPSRYLTRYFNTQNWKDLILLAADNDLDYTDHIRLMKYTKNN